VVRSPASPDSEIMLFDGLCSLRWQGTNCLIIKTKDTCLIVDPHFSRPGLLALTQKIAPRVETIRQELDRLDLEKVDAILITHTHYDHFLDALETAKLTGADLYGSESVVQATGLNLPSGRVHLIEPGVQYVIGEFGARFTMSSHLKFPGKLADWVHFNGKIEQPLNQPVWFWQYRAGTVYNILLEMEGCRLYIEGSAGIDRGNLAVQSANVAILSIAGLGFKNRLYCQAWFNQTVIQTGVQEVFFSHWDHFFQPWGLAPRDLPGTRRVIRWIDEMSAACPGVQFKRLFPS